MNAQFSLRSLFFVLIATAMLMSWLTIFPAATGIDAARSNIFVYAALFGGTIAGANFALFREHFLSVRYVMRVSIATFIAILITCWIISMEAANTGVQGLIYVVPETAILSAVYASFVSLCLPKSWMIALHTMFFSSSIRIPNTIDFHANAIHRLRSPTVSFWIAWNLIALGSLLPCLFLDSWFRVLGFVVPVFGPNILASVPMWLCRTASVQVVFVLSTVSYCMWLLYLHSFVLVRAPSTLPSLTGVAQVIYLGLVIFSVWLHYRSRRLVKY